MNFLSIALALATIGAYVEPYVLAGPNTRLAPQTQHISGNAPPIHVNAGSACYTYTTALDLALSTHWGARFFTLVGRSGTRDRSARWNKRRLHNVRTYLADSQIQLARFGSKELDPRDRLGTIEIYADDVLIAVLDVNPNQDLIISWGCEGDHFDYYPSRDFWLKHFAH